MKMRQYLFTLIVLLGGLCVAWSTQPAADEAITLRTLPSQTVLYTVIRGSYDKLGEAFGRLYAVAGTKQLPLRGPAMSVHLNNPKRVASEHRLTEIRIPVDKTALELTGTLGPMTDVKNTPETLAAVGLKPPGVSDPAPILERVYTWIYQNGYSPADASMQIPRSGSETHDYSQMEVEILVPVVRMPMTDN